MVRVRQKARILCAVNCCVEGRIAMKSHALPVTLLITLMFGATASAQTPSWTPPSDSARCPSKWGATDERGAGNHMKPQSVLNAVKLIKTGEVFELGHVLNAQMPLSPGRIFNMQVKRTAPASGTNQRTGNEEIITAEMGQVGTQFDGFAHQSHNNVHYNCFKTADIETRNGFTKLGIHNVGMLTTRGVRSTSLATRASRCSTSSTRSAWPISKAR
jgi:hypothetical protein